MIYDAVVVGTGFGGAVTGCRLAQAGRRVLLLERGRRWRTEDYPRKLGDPWLWDADEPERHGGWLDLRIMDDMWVAQGAGVGGGSLIYANVSIDAKQSVLDSGWPAEITFDALRPFYDEVGAMLAARPIPAAQETARLKLMREAATAIGEERRFAKLDLAVTFDEDWRPNGSGETHPTESRSWTNRFGKAQGTCTHCGNCDIGCEVNARNTLDLNYLAAAETAGAEIRPHCLVTHVSKRAEGYEVHVDLLEDGRRVAQTVTARAVVLAAGSLGSTEILLRSRDLYRTLPDVSGFLGHNWSSNGDFLTPARYPGQTISPTVGPTITAAIDFLDGSENGARFFVEDGGFPDVLGHLIAATTKRRGRWRKQQAMTHWRSLMQGRDPLSEVMPWFGQGIDATNGKLYLGRSWLKPWKRKLKLDWDVRRSATAIEGLIAMHKRLSAATGGEAIVPPTWTVLGNLVTPHPLGGCAMAASAASGVVDHAGRVFGYPGLYVADGAIVPRAIGLNPSKTIAALAERNVGLMLA